MSQQSYSDLETSRSKSTTKIGSLAKVFEVDAYWLETGIGPMRYGVGEPRASYLLGEIGLIVSAAQRLSDRKRRALLTLLMDDDSEGG